LSDKSGPKPAALLQMALKAWTEPFADRIVRFQVLRMEDSALVWAAAGHTGDGGDSASLPNLALAMPRPRGGASATKVVPGAGCDAAANMAERLSR